MRVRILPYKQYSASAKALSRALGIKRLSLVRTRFVPRRGDIVVNWGSTLYMGEPAVVLNDPLMVDIARDKLKTFRVLVEHSVPTVEWTTDPNVVWTWLRAGALLSHEVAGFARTSLTGQGGSGIVPFYHGTEYGPEGEVWPRAPLYTRLFKAKHEYRVHVAGDSVHVAKKRRRDGAPKALIRNHANGYVYCTENVSAPEPVIRVAIAAIRALGLDFGAVDMLCTDKGDARVLEVNTAPGLEGRTLEFYVKALGEEIRYAKDCIRRTRQDQVAV